MHLISTAIARPHLRSAIGTWIADLDLYACHARARVQDDCAWIETLSTDALYESALNARTIGYQLDHFERDKARACYLWSYFFKHHLGRKERLTDWVFARRDLSFAPATF